MSETPERGPSTWSRVTRALPRIAGLLVGLSVMRSDEAVLVAVGAALFVGSIWTNPVTWWRYVMTGHRPEPSG